MRLLLDTCVLSELLRPSPRESVVRVMSSYPGSAMFLSVVTFGELHKGVHLLPAGKRRRELEQWLAQLDREYQANVIPIDRDIVCLWGQLTADCRRRGITLSAGDGLLAATALKHSLVLVTTNQKDFVNTGVKLYDLK